MFSRSLRALRKAPLQRSGGVGCSATHPPPPKAATSINLTDLRETVLTQILDGGYFTYSFTNAEVNYYFERIGFSELYWRSFTPQAIAQHVTAYMSAKRLALMGGDGDFDQFEYSSAPAGFAPALFMCADIPERRLEMEKRIQEYLTNRDKAHRRYGFSVKVFRSREAVEGDVHVMVYIVDWSPWARPAPLRDVSGNLLDSAGFDDVELDEQGRVTPACVKAWTLKHSGEEPPRFVADDIEDVCVENFLTSKKPEFVGRYFKAIQHMSSSVTPYVSVSEIVDEFGENVSAIVVSFPRERRSYLAELGELFSKHGISPVRRFVEAFSNDVEVYTLYCRERAADLPQGLISSLGMLSLVPSVYATSGHAQLREEYIKGNLSPEEVMYAYSGMIFAFYFAKAALTTEEYHQLCKVLQADPLNLARLDSIMEATSLPTMTEVRIVNSFVTHLDFLKTCFEDFKQKAMSNDMQEPSAELLRRGRRELRTVVDQAIFKSLVVFNGAVAKTNFFKPDKGAVSFRLDCAAIQKYLTFPFHEVPYAMIMFTGAHFRGFHIRYADVSRGGIRLIPHTQTGVHEVNKQRLLDENLSLAWTQHNKNKDIPEGGSKGVILASPHYFGAPRALFDRYIHAMLDILLPNEHVVDRYRQPEILFLGPDENTADFMGVAAQTARQRGYGYWQAFTTGKPPDMGGVPHDKYGMTTASVRVYVEGIQKELDLNPAECTKVQIGGPDGDLGSNEILCGLEKTLAMVDKTGCIFDPEGLNRDELVRLAHDRSPLAGFDTSLLGPGGFRVMQSDEHITLPNGFHVDRGVSFCNMFHLNPIVRADFFVPCGGRPRSVDISNVYRLLPDKHGDMKFKYIVEGANLFFTEDARMQLERAGVIMFKDASANKGGVTSSSLEVFSGLALTSEQHASLMCVEKAADGTYMKPPDFYATYVKAILEFIRYKAKMEFDLLWREGKKSGRTRSELSLLFSRKINNLFDRLYHSSVIDIHHGIGREALRRAVPAPLAEVVTLEELYERVPDMYLRSMVCAQLSAEYIYRFGSDADEVVFFDYVSDYLNAK
eukprot:TRINITY_DN33509_c0_g1_i1.p1 TRINITY_DN33509_c0_g1~~TRINITY_DN33509_c0_g1_i1.p1  ORF type:complete len:1058 (-),score=356.03 TRINITY_DN33509_c0_g1_i1:339-3512(-)